MIHTNIVRPNWHQSHMEMAIKASHRSCDYDTKVGAVLVDPFENIIGTGYNSFAQGFPDDILPNTRDSDNSKHDWMVHAEINCLVRKTTNTFAYSEGVKMYCTIRPCIRCFGPIVNSNVKFLYTIKGALASNTLAEQDMFFQMLEYSRIKYYELKL